MNAHSSQLGFTDYVAMVWTRRSAALLAAGLFACITFIAFNFVPRKYAATCVFERRGNVISARTSGLPESFGNLKPLLVYHLTGREAIHQGLTDLGYLETLEHDAAGKLTPDASAQLSRTLGTIQRNLHTSWIIKMPNLDRLSLRLTSQDPVMATALPNQMVKNYIASTRVKLVGQLNRSATYLRQRIDESQTNGDVLREQRYNFLKGHPDMMPGNPQFLTQQIERTVAEIEDVQRQQKAVQSRFAILQSLEAGGMGGMIANPDYVAAAERIQRLRQKLEQHRTVGRKTAQHPKVISLRQMIAEGQTELATIPKQIASAPTSGTPTATTMALLRTEDARVEMERLAVSFTRKQEALQRYTEAQANFLPVAKEYGRLSEQIAMIDKEQQVWQGNLGTVQMALAAEQNGTRTHMEVIRAASPVYGPSWPALWHVFALALGGGVAFGISLVIVMSRLSRSFDSADEARSELGLPVLGVVGPILTPAARRLRAIRRYVLAPATVALLLFVTILAATGVVMSTNYPGRYAQIMEHVAPTTRAMWHGVQNLLGLI